MDSIESNIISQSELNQIVQNDIAETDSNISKRLTFAEKTYTMEFFKNQCPQALGDCTTVASDTDDTISETSDGYSDISDIIMEIPNIRCASYPRGILKTAHYKKEKLCALNDRSLMFSFNGECMGKPVRILVDSGSSIDVISDNITLPTSVHYTTENIELTTGSGKVHQEAKVLEPQSILVQGNSVTRELRQITLGDLPYDIILGMPFLVDYDPIARWRLGALQFPKFTWFADKELIAGIESINTISVAKDLARWNKTHLEEDAVDCYVISTQLLSQDEDLDKAISSNLTPTQREEMRELVLKYKHRDSIGSEKDNLPHRSEMPIRPEHWHLQIPLDPTVTAEPHTRARPLSTVEMQELKRQLTFLLAHGFIKRSTSRFASPTLFVKKKDGTLRWCCDYRVLNEKSFTPSSPLPRIDTLIDKLTTAKFFTALDLIQGYHQLPVHPDDTWKTAIITPFGLFEWTVVPFGLSGAPTHFQKIMSELFGPLTSFGNTVLNLLDDLLIYTDTWEEHLSEVERVLRLLEEKQFYINFRKCSFGQDEVVYVGPMYRQGDP